MPEKKKIVKKKRMHDLMIIIDAVERKMGERMNVRCKRMASLVRERDYLYP